MKNLILLLAVLIPAVALAQEVVERDASGFAVIKDGNGELRTVFSPTPQFALEAILAEDRKGAGFADRVFRQKWETRSDAELDAFADELVRIVLETPSIKVARDAINALGSYSRRLEVLIDIYENPQNTRVSLSNIFRIPNGGKDYVMNLFASLEPPKEPCKPRPSIGLDNGPPGPPEEELCPYKTDWCEVGKVLIGHGVHHSLIYPTCDNRIEYTEDGLSIWHSH